MFQKIFFQDDKNLLDIKMVVEGTSVIAKSNKYFVVFITEDKGFDSAVEYINELYGTRCTRLDKIINIQPEEALVVTLDGKGQIFCQKKEKAESADVPESAGEASKAPAELSAPPETPVLAGREEPLALSGKETPAALPGAKEETLPDANGTKNN